MILTSDRLAVVVLMDLFPTLAGANDLVQAGEPPEVDR
jgi:hypothetical protein